MSFKENTEIIKEGNEVLRNDDVVINETFCGNLKRFFDVSLSSVIVEQLFNEALKKAVGDRQIPGFRKGKALPHVMKQHCDADAILNQVVIDKSLSVLSAFLSANGKSIANNPKILTLDVLNYKNAKQNTSCSFELEIMPDVPLIDCSAIELSSYNVEISHDDLEKKIDELVTKSKKYVKEDSTEYEIKSGDIIVVDFVGKIAGEVFKGGSAKDFRIVLGEGRVLSDIELAIIGMHLNETKIIQSRFPDDYHEQDVAGKEVVFSLSVNAVEKCLPFSSVDDLITDWQCVDIEDLRKKVKNSMDHSVKNMNRHLMAYEFASKVDLIYNFDLPESVIAEEVEDMKKHAELNVEGADSEKILEKARTRVKIGMMIDRFAKEKGIKVETEDIAKRVFLMANNNVDYARQLMDVLGRDINLFRSISADVLENKVIDIFLSQVKSVEQCVTFEKLLQIAGKKND